ncbi:MAG: hypothetical protein RIB98_07725 [Acidimicrobiales bacterium]
MSEQKRAPRSGNVVRTGLFAVTLAVGVSLAAIPVGNWLDQRSEVDDARARHEELVAEITGIDNDIEAIVGEEGLEIAARCYGPFVEVGEELYAVPGLDGCVTNPTP